MNDRQRAQGPLAIAAIASAGAAVMHATAAGIHADHPTLSRTFVAITIAQAAAAVVGFLRSGRIAIAVLVSVNAFAFGGWLVTRFAGISWFPGLEVAESPQLADSIAAVLALVAVVAAASALGERSPLIPSRAVVSSAVLVGVMMVPGLLAATDHDHSGHDADGHSTAAGTADDGHAHDDETTASDDGHAHSAETTAGEPTDTDEHGHDDAAADDDHAHESGEAAGASGDTDDPVEPEPPAWPRPWDPTAAIDFSGVPGVTAGQLARAEQLAADTLRDLPAFADVSTVSALGYRSIGDSSTGFEHYINVGYIADEKFLDPTAPESLVYQVDGDARTLVSAMFIAKNMPMDDPALVDIGGPLMEWHVHLNLCWGLNEAGEAVVKSVLENLDDACPAGTVNAGGENPMVHVWIAPHDCGPFAALEGHGAGQTATGTRSDQCAHDNHEDGPGDGDGDGDGHGTAEAAATKPYDPTMPIDLGGIDGVTPQQQAFAENLVAATIRDLPQWADLEAVAAAGFHSIGDGATGHEHYIQWDWIDDDIILDPDFPESLVFEPQPDGSKKLVSAMFMLPRGVAVEDAPDFGGALMQWHVHGDLCFTDDPVAPKVVGVKAIGTTCRAPLVDGTLAPMVHVWITPTPCGPFAALEGIGAGQVAAGEEALCDTAHGSH
ncbi:MAG TPA: hypothetical protein VMM60_12895 [Ilumatobacter sp.]|nr:hypothetical protein [Ilumatobacter sp.]